MQDCNGAQCNTEVEMSPQIFVFFGQTIGGDTEHVASVDTREPVVKLQFNISHIFAVLMINFFVCRVDSLRFSSGYQPPPTPAAHYGQIKLNFWPFAWLEISGNF
ncbi:hypothetical protein EXN66_Car021213 [Channa argus]|uniref:Uncharacterized protein n=1 Tax=Channa argus TaxID=215402 RepID=A0A6G1QSF1_CHAAH|nr:hypothetical protein EXN66_Car021213 [Channa argus]